MNADVAIQTVANFVRRFEHMAGEVGTAPREELAEAVDQLRDLQAVFRGACLICHQRPREYPQWHTTNSEGLICTRCGVTLVDGRIAR